MKISFEKKRGVFMGYINDFFEKNKSNHGWYTCVRCGKKLRKSDVDIDHIIPQVEAAATVFLIYNVCAKLATVPNKIAWDWIR